MDSVQEISELMSQMESQEIDKFIREIMTESELSVLSKRWRILKMLFQGVTQRQIAEELGVSLCKVTRGSKIIKNQNTVINRCLKKENEDVRNEK